jgi:hypothetical protein
MNVEEEESYIRNVEEEEYRIEYRRRVTQEIYIEEEEGLHDEYS